MKPIILDTETTGLRSPQAIEVAFIELANDLQELQHRFSEENTPKYKLYSERFNPTKAIEVGASKVHGIYKKDLVGCRKTEEFELPEHTYMIGHNIAFDHRVLARPDTTLICTKELAVLAFQEEKKSGKLRNHKQTTLIEFLYPDRPDLLENAHGALADCMMVYHLLLAIVHRLPYCTSYGDLAKLCSQPKKVEELPYEKVLTVMPFGKHKGVKFSDVPPDYLRWLGSQNDLSPSLEAAIKLALN